MRRTEWLRRIGAAVVAVCAVSQPAAALSPWLYGVHWYGTDGDVEDLTGGKGVWLLETVMVWEGAWTAAAQKSKFQTAVSRGHTTICRIQPRWGYAVPTEAEMASYLVSVAAAAQTLDDECHIWQIGNEMNGLNEYGGQYLEPAVYVERFKQIRDAIKGVTSSLGEQMVLLGPPSVLSPYWSQMLALVEPGDFDGFTMHAYGTTPDNTDVNRNVQNFMEAVEGQLDWIDAASGKPPGTPGVFRYKPVFITEFDRCNDPPNDPVQEATGSQFLYQAYGKLYDWNLAQGDYLGMDTHAVVGAMWFIYPESSENWDCYSLLVHKAGPRGQNVNLWDAFQYACTLDYPAGLTGPTLQVIPYSFAREVSHQTDLPDDTFEISNTWSGNMAYTITENGDWLSVSPASGTWEGDVDTITITYDTAGLTVGPYTADITVTAPSAFNSPQVVPVTLDVLLKPGDFDFDGDVDQADFGRFQICYTAVGAPQNAPECQPARMDADVDVDHDDFALFQACISGADIPADPTCTE